MAATPTLNRATKDSFTTFSKCIAGCSALPLMGMFVARLGVKAKGPQRSIRGTIGRVLRDRLNPIPSPRQYRAGRGVRSSGDHAKAQATMTCANVHPCTNVRYGYERTPPVMPSRPTLRRYCEEPDTHITSTGPFARCSSNEGLKYQPCANQRKISYTEVSLIDRGTQA